MAAIHKYLPAIVILALAAAAVWILKSTARDTGAGAPTDTSPVADPPATGLGIGVGPGIERTPLGALAGVDEKDVLRIRGRVLDPFGEPVAGAMIGEAGAEAPTVSTAEGRFELAVVADRGSIPMLVLAAGHAPFFAALEIPGAVRVHDAGDLQLLRGARIRGRVTEASGSALAGASVTLHWLPAGAAPAALDLGALLRPAHPDSQGAYAFANLMPGNYRVTATAPGMQSKTSGTVTVHEGGETVVDPLGLSVGHVLAGVVLAADDLLVAGAAVRVQNGANQPRFDARADTGSDGRFRLDAVPPGPLRVEVTRAGYLRFERADVDATTHEDLVVRLEAGLRVDGAVVDAVTRRPVERFAATIRRIGEIDPRSNGSMVQQLLRQMNVLRAEAAAAADARVRDEKLEIATQFAGRLAALRRNAPERAVAVPADVGAVAERPGGRFAFEGLEEGIYAVGIQSPGHSYAEAKPVELRRGVPAPALLLALHAGHAVSGVVVARRDGGPVAAAAVELVRVAETPPDAESLRRSLYPWAFARSGPGGVVVRSARTSADGGFEFPHSPPGRYLLAVRHARFADHETEPFVVPGGPPAIRVALGARARLSGRVGNVPASGERRVEVLVLGGHGTLRTVNAATDGAYRVEDLQPGSYLVRAFPAEASQYQSRFLASIFPLHAGAVNPERIPPCDLTLVEGEDRVLDLVVDLPATGTVEGTVSILGRAAAGCAVVLRPFPGEAPGSGDLPVRTQCDAAGSFALRDVPAGKYTLLLYGTTRQELHGEPLVVAPAAIATVRRDLAAGGLRGRVLAPDATSSEEVRGYVWVLPGAPELPAELYEYRRIRRTHRIQVRNGAFEDAELTPGPALVIADVRGRSRASARVTIPAGQTVALDLGVPPRGQ